MEDENFRKIMNIPFSVIVASFITIIITSKVEDKNGLSGLIGGYSGLLAGLFFIVLLLPLYDPTLRNYSNNGDFKVFLNLMKELFPIMVPLGIISLLIFYLYTYFDKIATGEVSSYYNSFLTLSTVLLAFQISAISNAIYSKSQNMNIKIFTDINYSLIVMFGIVNSLVVITLGIILRFYSTQG